MMATRQEIARRIAKERVAAADAAVEQAERDRVREAAEKFFKEWGGDGTLPAGRQGDSLECVFAHAMGGQWNGADWATPEERTIHRLGYDRIDLPKDVRDFISRFDHGEYPDLIQAIAESDCE